jgi:hypothetical protein
LDTYYLGNPEGVEEEILHQIPDAKLSRTVVSEQNECRNGLRRHPQIIEQLAIAEYHFPYRRLVRGN